MFPRRRLLTVLAVGCLSLVAGPAAAQWRFTEVAAAAGLRYEHGFGSDPVNVPHLVSGGVAAGDFDGDGWEDLYVVRGSLGPNLLFRNRGVGPGVAVVFEEIGAAAGVALGGLGAGPTFGDLDGDGWLDLVIGGVGQPPRLFRNRGDGTFEEVTATSGVFATRDTFSTALGDVDRDGDLDLFLSHFVANHSGPPLLYRNDGGGSRRPASAASTR